MRIGGTPGGLDSDGYPYALQGELAITGRQPADLGGAGIRVHGVQGDDASVAVAHQVGAGDLEEAAAGQGVGDGAVYVGEEGIGQGQAVGNAMLAQGGAGRGQYLGRAVIGAGDGDVDGDGAAQGLLAVVADLDDEAVHDFIGGREDLDIRISLIQFIAPADDVGRAAILQLLLLLLGQRCMLAGLHDLGPEHFEGAVGAGYLKAGTLPQRIGDAAAHPAGIGGMDSAEAGDAAAGVGVDDYQPAPGLTVASTACAGLPRDQVAVGIGQVMGQGWRVVGAQNAEGKG